MHTIVCIFHLFWSTSPVSAEIKLILLPTGITSTLRRYESFPPAIDNSPVTKPRPLFDSLAVILFSFAHQYCRLVCVLSSSKKLTACAHPSHQTPALALVHSLVASPVDYGNSLLFGLRLSLYKLQTSAEVCCCSTPIIARTPVPSSHYSCVESRNNEAFK